MLKNRRNIVLKSAKFTFIQRKYKKSGNHGSPTVLQMSAFDSLSTKNWVKPHKSWSISQNNDKLVRICSKTAKNIQKFREHTA